MKNNRSVSLVVLGTLVLWGCRFEREPAGSPFAVDGGVTQVDANPATASGGRSAAGSGGKNAHTPIDQSDAGPQSGSGGNTGAGAAGAGGDTGKPAAGAGGTAGGPQEQDASVIAGDGGSCTPAVEGCNPVTNEGCPPSMQCAIDPVAETPAGYCIFSAPMPMADGSCFNSGVTESCPASSTCFDFQCRTLCFCDADCEKGDCCVEPVGSAGFKVCGEC